MNLTNIRQKLSNRDYDYPEPEWTPENINRKPGSTTFKQCGWCKYRGCGSCRYNCCIDTSCSLFPDYGLGHQTYWDTPCLIKLLGKDDIDDLIRYKNYKVEELKKTIQRKEGERKILQNLKPAAKPPLPSNRGDTFNEGKTIWLYRNKKWIRGVIVEGYRSHDGCVSYILDDIKKSKPQPQGTGPWGCGASIPGILLDWEYKYFQDNPNDFKIWLNLSDVKYNGERYDVQEMYDALRGNEK